MRIHNINPKAFYDIPGFDGKYQINFYAKIRRVLKNGRYKELCGYVKKSNGRHAVKLNCKEYVVMHLMRDTFIGALPDGYVLYHKNGCITEDALYNIGMIKRCELGRLTGRRNNCETSIVKINSNGEIIDFYKSVREAGRKNFMSYQTILDRINGKVKSLYAPDGYVYVKENERQIQNAIRRIELDNKKECGVTFIKAPEVIFDF